MTSFFIWLGGVLLSMFLVNRGYFDKFWAFTVLITGFLYESWRLVGYLTVRAFQQILSVFAAPGQAPCAAGPSHWFAIANTFFPVDESLHLLAALASLAVLLGAYRLITSWIPVIGPKG